MKTVWILSGVVGVLLLIVFLMYTSVKDAQKKIDRAETLIKLMEARIKDDSTLYSLELEKRESLTKIKWLKHEIRDTVFIMSDSDKIRLFTELTNSK